MFTISHLNIGFVDVAGLNSSKCIPRSPHFIVCSVVTEAIVEDFYTVLGNYVPTQHVWRQTLCGVTDRGLDTAQCKRTFTGEHGLRSIVYIGF